MKLFSKSALQKRKKKSAHPSKKNASAAAAEPPRRRAAKDGDDVTPPRSRGYAYPDEWEEHSGTMMIFPSKRNYGRQVRGMQKEFCDVALAIAENEHVIVFVHSDDERRCREMFGDGTSNVTIRVDDSYRIDWARDNAPMILRNEAANGGQLATAGFRFNGWGEKYKGWERDVGTRDAVAETMGWPILKSDLVLEGGSIEIARGVGIVTESCVLNENRLRGSNSGGSRSGVGGGGGGGGCWTKPAVEEKLKSMLGLNRIIWIKSGLMPDPMTDGHVDGLLKFVGPNTVLLHTTEDKRDVNYQICQDAKAVLQKEGIEVIELPLMEDMVHMNYYIGSGGGVAYVPICGKPEQDEPALEVIRGLGLYEKVVTIEATALYKEGGGIHCCTMQIPE